MDFTSSKNKTILVTGAAGFIGFHLCNKLIELGHNVVGLDNINDYYDINLKFARLNELGINRHDAEIFDKLCNSSLYGDQLQFIRMNLEDREKLPRLFQNFNFDMVCNLAAQAGVRYSLENPEAYVDSNIVGFLNVLECCRHNNVKKLVYASSSSVYGNNESVPFKESEHVDYPISLYAASKKSNELMAHTYSHLYNIETIGLRFFTVYGPWGRPDMAMFLFTDAILNNRPIKVFNEGNLSRDFTYIDDIIEGVVATLLGPSNNANTYKLYNIGNNQPVKLLDFIEAIEKETGIAAEKLMMPMQPGDVEKTWADGTALTVDFNYTPKVPLIVGVYKFISWYRTYFKIALELQNSENTK
ncbi:NAD-dependent epimerase [Mangrovimonas aestuarii]|uniref:NAD-dependent epimerase n=1 Tax=Mangrovimonas aestuarii TaxID=3018443 RepID=UPI00237979FD|nr:NAD-dependent epimerase [Mangrovimonas aestuarii]